MVVDTTVTAAMLDDNKTTIKKYNWPTTRKWDYVAPLLANGDKDGCYQDIVYLRLADTYLLYAEALLKNNQAGEAIKWINKVRNVRHLYHRCLSRTPEARWLHRLYSRDRTCCSC